jgi:hypothetical protein
MFFILFCFFFQGKVFVDQLMFSPFFNWFYFYQIGFLEYKTLEQIEMKVANELLPLMLMNYKV